MMLLLLSVYAYASFQTPKCSEMSAREWKSNRDVCYTQFKNQDMPNGASADKLCSCVADAIVNEMSCADIKRYTADDKFAAETRAHISKHCIHENTSKP